jgi:tetratricopeptide (TPR) repeat protein
MIPFDQRGQHVENQYNIVNQAPPAPLAPNLHQLPPPPGDFTGRQAELETLTAKFADGVSISGVRGMGGVGKTALALKLADLIKDRYPDAQFFIELHGSREKPLTPAEGMLRVIRAFYPTQTFQLIDESEVQKQYRSVLHGKRALILLDDAKDAPQVTPLLPPTSCVVLITSREHFHIPGLHSLDLEQMSLDEAHELLLAISPRIDKYANEIAKLCGCLPLALRAVGSLFASAVDLEPSRYVAELREECARLENIGSEGIDIGVQASLKLSYDRLPPKTARVFCQLAVFPESFDAAAEEVVADDANHFNLSILVKRSLVLFDPVSKRYRLHDLARLFAKQQIGPEHLSAPYRRHAKHYLEIASETDRLFDQGHESQVQALALFDLEWRNIQFGQAWAAAHITEGVAIAKLCSEYAISGIYCCRLRQHPSESIRWSEASLIAARKLGNRKDEAHHLGNLGLAYAVLNDMKRAIDYYEAQIEIDHAIDYERGEANALNNLGLAFAALGEIQQAIKCYEQSLIIKRKLKDRRGEGNTLGNLGAVLGLSGNIEQEIDHLKQWVNISKEIGDLLSEAKALGNLGRVYADLGDMPEALECYQKALAAFIKIGSGHDRAIVLNNLGDAFVKLGQSPDAIKVFENAKDVAHQSGNVRSEITAVESLGNLYAVQRDFQKAIDYYKQSLQIVQDTGDRIGETRILNSLGTIYGGAGEFDKAVSAYERQLEICRETYDRNGEALALGMLGVAYYFHGDNLLAIKLYEDAVRIFQEIGGRHDECLAYINMGNAYASLQETHKAIDLYQLALTIAYEIEDRHLEGNSNWNMALALDELGDRTKAIACAEAAVKSYEMINDSQIDLVRQHLANWASQA